MTAAIETRGLRKVYPGTGGSGAVTGAPGWAGSPPSSARGSGETVALEGLDLVVNEGEFFGLIGPNGAGKTT
ncbi:MAG TPA: hypothetical protein VIG47_04285, partial [Gemmatimonadaceae bacterium]